MTSGTVTVTEGTGTSASVAYTVTDTSPVGDVLVGANYPEGQTDADMDAKFLPAGKRLALRHIEYVGAPPGPWTGFPSVDRNVCVAFNDMPSEAQFVGWLRRWTYPYTLFWNYRHEIDAAIKRGNITLAEFRANLATLLGWASQAGTNVCSILCLCNYSVDTSNPLYEKAGPDQYFVDGLDVLGVDFDGVAPGDTAQKGYPSKVPGIDDHIAWGKAHNLPICAPEWGAHRAAWDPQGTARAAWITEQGKLFAQGNYLWTSYFDSSVNEPPATAEDTMLLTTPAEIAAFAGLALPSALG